jgi:tripartite ATP-independent transporter DctM subunit
VVTPRGDDRAVAVTVASAKGQRHEVRGDGIAAIADAIDAVLGPIIALPSAILVVAEVCILFSGAVARYVFRHPLVWSDELASLLFLWLAMLGAAYALRRGEHMRMGALVSLASEPWRRFFNAMGGWATLTFLVFVAKPSIMYAQNEAFLTSPGLGISGAWRAAAFPVGIALMALISMLHLLRMPDPRRVLSALIPVAIMVAAFYLLHPYLNKLGNINLIIFFVGVIAVCIFAGVPIAFSFGLATLGYLLFTTRIPASIVVGRMDEGMNQVILLAVPMFIFLGQLMEMTGMAKAMVDFLAHLVGRARGGLNYVLIAAMYVVSGISGAKSADMAAVAPALFPEMIRRGASEGDLVALLAATGAQTETVPPSIVLLAIGAVTGVSISALFIGGLLPAFIMGVMLCLVVRYRHRRDRVSSERRAPAREIARAFVLAVPALALPFLIRTTVIEGMATATEVSTIGIIYSLIVGLVVYRRFDWRRLGPMLVYTASLSGAILLIIGAATGVSWGLTQSGFSNTLTQAMVGLPGGAGTFMALSVLLFIVLGSVLEGIPAVVLFAPLLFPIARDVGIHEVQYAVVVIVSMGVGLFLPPFGVGYYTACAIARIDPAKGLRPIVGYMGAVILGLILLAAVPWLSIGFL